MQIQEAILTGQRLKRCKAAFSLVEVMLAVCMAAVIFAAVGFGLSTGFSVVQLSREQLRANQICLSRMEGVRLCNWDTQLFNTNIVPNTFTEYFYPVGFGNQAVSYVTYSGTMTLDTNITFSPTPSYASKLCMVTVVVTWTNSSRGMDRICSQTMKSIVSRNGIQNYVFTH